MKFTTPCFVRIEDADKRETIIRWGHDLGYNTVLVTLPRAYWISAHNGEMSSGERHWPGIDCGTDIELFKALAAMNNENDREQWFTDTADGFSKCSVDRWLDEWQPEYHDRYSIWRKATAEEIIEHFKNR